MKKLIILIFSTTLFLILSSKIIFGQTSSLNSVEDTAREITISLIQILSDGKQLKAGSGVLIAKEDDWYDVLTVAHNLRLDEPEIDIESLIKKLRIKTYDGRLHLIRDYERISDRELGKLDLVIIRFKSNKTYQTGTFLNAQNKPITQNQSSPVTNDLIYVAGFPQSAEGFRIDSGRFLEFIEPSVDQSSLSDPQSEDIIYFDENNPLYAVGYSLRYEADRKNGMDKGMSGGAVLNTKGEIIGIHGRDTELGNKLGTDINTFWQSISSSLQNRIRNNHSRFSPPRQPLFDATENRMKDLIDNAPSFYLRIDHNN